MVDPADTTNTKALEQELRQTVARYEAILASTLDPVITIDFRGRILAASESVRRVFGWAPQELCGRNISVLMPEPHATAHDGYLARYRASGVTNILGRAREFEGVRRDGSRVPIVVSVSRVDIPGEDQPLFTGIVHDITEQRAAEAELARYREHLESLVERRSRQLEASHEQLRVAERLVSIGTLAAGVGHDISNVLLPVRTRLDALDRAGLPADCVEHFEAVRAMVEYLQQLSDGLHLLALDPSDDDASTPDTDLPEWWGQVGSLLGQALPRGVQLSTDLDDALPRIAISPHRLTQAVLNLIVNAGEAMDDGTGRVQLWARVDPEDDGFVRVGVTDDGHGMTPEVLRQARDPFFTTKKRGLGTGLGLSLAHGAARAAGGSLDIESTRGEGTTVTLRVPRAASARALRDALPSAMITVGEPRIGALVSTLLAGVGVPVVQDVNTDDADGADGACLWITDAADDRLPAARAFLAAVPRRRVVVLGAASPSWHDLGATVVAQPTDLHDLREKLTSAISAIVECSGAFT